MNVRHLALFALLTSTLFGAGCFGGGDDEDGLSKEFETRGWTITFTGPDGNVVEKEVRSSPTKEDTDGDGQDDFREAVSGTDPSSADTDGDGLKDGQDLTLNEDAARAKRWVEDGLVHKRQGGRVTFFGEWDHQAEPTKADTDSDGLLDGEEVGGMQILVCGEERTVQTLARQEDTDDDKVFDLVEINLGLDPTRDDTDGDGVSDLVDIDSCGDFHVAVPRLVFTLLNEGLAGPFSLELHVQGEDLPYSVGPFDAQSGDPVDLSGQFADSLQVADDQANVRAMDFNATFTLFGYEYGGSTPTPIDIASTVTGTDHLQIAFDARLGHQRALAEPDEPASDPGTRIYEGLDARIEIHFASATLPSP